MTFHSSRGRGRRLPASGSFDIGYLALCVAVLPHAIFRPLPGGSPMGADRPMFHASPPGGSLPIREFVCDLPLPLPMLRRPSASSFRPAPRRPPLSNSAPRFQPPLGLVLLLRLPRLCQLREHVPRPLFPVLPGSPFVVTHFPLTIVLDGALVFLSSKCPSMSPLPLFQCTSPFDPSSLWSVIFLFILPVLISAFLQCCHFHSSVG